MSKAVAQAENTQYADTLMTLKLALVGHICRHRKVDIIDTDSA